MDTLTTTQTLTLEAIDLETLREQMLEARANKEAAWKTQSLTTAEEGFTSEQSNAATRQALDAEFVYRQAWRAYDAAKAAAIAAVEDAEIDVTPMGGW